ncbi:glycosyltransferase [Ameyamaea chiangmaiensis NBRC 103196]|uniref:Glycosyltransferase family 2 protein n=2 Tax=Ameyamaea chiangmaiensis TaxID=442969 RepID=A0A850PD96_9PROT|nr:glycosyltransferase family 2 protein [Ameyamaea chiangmaiensis]NVN40873.1 glycosyltransferase family 2 protein [Ameyamaea chiangmaiensis]GBQ63106.1 glycosyltransferase [Ameyamaea chiangmaiensis NBRC 103196]
MVGGTDVTADRASRGHVAILLSLYNGEAFLNAQLDSFLAQTHADWTLYWRDDGSSDATVAIMRSFETHRGAGRCVEIDDDLGNLGPAASFHALLTRAPDGSFVAFADQDDVWFADKLERALARNADEAGPVLYCARQQLADRALVPIGLSPPLARSPDFPGALTQNIATGCTIVLNTAARRLLAAHAPPDGTLHDWWAYLLVSGAGGRIIFDEQPVLSYRQHGANSVGAAASVPRRAWRAARRGPALFLHLFATNIAALGAPGIPLAPEARVLVGDVRDALAGRARARIALLRHHPELRRQGRLENLVFRLWFVFGRGMPAGNAR